jgi:uncharacterized protein YkwD
MVLGSALMSVCVGMIYGTHATAVDPTPYLSPLEKEVLHEINLARTQPQTYMAFLAQLRPHFVGTTLQHPGDIAPATGRGAALVTHEGVRAVEEAIAFLRTTAPLPPLTISRGMSLGARDHVKDQGPAGGVGHQGRDGSYSDMRVNRYGRWQGRSAENIAYGIASARGITMTFIIDDGVPGRGHRHNLFEPQSHVVGVACGSHRTWQIMCVLTFAAGYVERTTQ